MLLLSCTGVDAVGTGVVAEGTGAVDVMYCCCLCICCVCSCIVEVCGCCWCWCWVYRCWRCCTVVLGAMCSLPVAIDTVAMYSIVAMSCSVTDFIFLNILV